jgi:hypothetical protein
MKKLIASLLATVFISANGSGQQLKKAQARQILETAITSLRTSDTTAFLNLWHFDGKPAPYHEIPFTRKTALEYFHYMREFLDTALTRDLKIYEMELTKVGVEQQALNFGKYNIRAWFRYTDKYFKGFGFFIDYIEDKWMVRYIPDTSTRTSN